MFDKEGTRTAGRMRMVGSKSLSSAVAGAVALLGAKAGANTSVVGVVELPVGVVTLPDDVGVAVGVAMGPGQGGGVELSRSRRRCVCRTHTVTRESERDGQ